MKGLKIHLQKRNKGGRDQSLAEMEPGGAPGWEFVALFFLPSHRGIEDKVRPSPLEQARAAELH